MDPRVRAMPSICPFLQPGFQRSGTRSSLIFERMVTATRSSETTSDSRAHSSVG